MAFRFGGCWHILGTQKIQQEHPWVRVSGRGAGVRSRSTGSLLDPVGFSPAVGVGPVYRHLSRPPAGL